MSTIKQALSQDGMRRMRIVRSIVSNLFSFVEEKLVIEDAQVTTVTYWLPCHESGLYESPDEAERAAYSELPWLRDENSN